MNVVSHDNEHQTRNILHISARQLQLTQIHLTKLLGSYSTIPSASVLLVSRISARKNAVTHLKYNFSPLNYALISPFTSSSIFRSFQHSTRKATILSSANILSNFIQFNLNTIKILKCSST